MYPIVVSHRGGFTNKQKRKLRSMGLKWDGLACSGVVSTKWRADRIKRFCEANSLTFRIRNSLGNRNNSCRRIFFSNYKPQVLGRYYICAYCGKLRTKDNITVDHVYSIGASAESVSYQNKLRRRGIENINDPKNLVAACKKCNAKKRTDGGIWVLRAKLGRYKSIWYLRWFLRMAILVVIIILILQRPELREAIVNAAERVLELIKGVLEG